MYSTLEFVLIVVPTNGLNACYILTFLNALMKCYRYREGDCSIAVGGMVMIKYVEH